jgi:hypothetical protein
MRRLSVFFTRAAVVSCSGWFVFFKEIFKNNPRSGRRGGFLQVLGVQSLQPKTLFFLVGQAREIAVGVSDGSICTLPI